MRRELRVNSQCSQQPSSVRELCPRFDAALLLAFEPSGGPGHLVRLPVSRQVGEGDKLYGSVTHPDIEEAHGQAGYARHAEPPRAPPSPRPSSGSAVQALVVSAWQSKLVVPAERVRQGKEISARATEAVLDDLSDS